MWTACLGKTWSVQATPIFVGWSEVWRTAPKFWTIIWSIFCSKKTTCCKTRMRCWRRSVRSPTCCCLEQYFVNFISIGLFYVWKLQLLSTWPHVIKDIPKPTVGRIQTWIYGLQDVLQLLYHRSNQRPFQNYSWQFVGLMNTFWWGTRKFLVKCVPQFSQFRYPILLSK